MQSAQQDEQVDEEVDGGHAVRLDDGQRPGVLDDNDDEDHCQRKLDHEEHPDHGHQHHRCHVALRQAARLRLPVLRHEALHGLPVLRHEARHELLVVRHEPA